MQLHKHTFQAMGSPCAVHYYAQASDAQQVAQSLVGEIERLEQKYSRYLNNSVASQINAVAAEAGTIQVDAETAALLDYAHVAWQESDGLFDITSGVLRQAWDFKSQRIPLQRQLNALLDRIGWHNVHWQENQLQFTVPGMELDFGGYVKEYAADCVAALAVKLGIESGLVELGGDIRVIGPHPDGRPWAVGVRHPTLANRVLATIELQQGAIASSGDYERCIHVNGKRYGHILNPKTGWPVEGLICATVVAPHCLLAGTTSTLALLKGEAGLNWLQDQDLPWLAMDNSGETHGTVFNQPQASDA